MQEHSGRPLPLTFTDAINFGVKQDGFWKGGGGVRSLQFVKDATLGKAIASITPKGKMARIGVAPGLPPNTSTDCNFIALLSRTPNLRRRPITERATEWWSCGASAAHLVQSAPASAAKVVLPGEQCGGIRDEFLGAALRAPVINGRRAAAAGAQCAPPSAPRAQDAHAQGTAAANSRFPTHGGRRGRGRRGAQAPVDTTTA